MERKERETSAQPAGVQQPASSAEPAEARAKAVLFDASKTTVWRSAIDVPVAGAPAADRRMSGKTLVWRSVVDIRLDPVPGESVAPTRPATAASCALDRTRIDEQQLPVKLRAAEIWARQATPGALTQVIPAYSDLVLPAEVVDAPTERWTFGRQAWLGRARRRRSFPAPQPSELVPTSRRRLQAVIGGLAATVVAASFALGVQMRRAQPGAAPASTASSVATATQSSATQGAAAATPSAHSVATTHLPSSQIEADTAPRIVDPTAVTPRSAIDALIAGQRQLSVERYRALARARPSEPAYQVAARIITRDLQRVLAD